ncbi:hypothetical protein MHUMG1_02600 [Metarhizium humberi]|uniref:Uncharacterized protein n=1 Tax=Metarhizium humberi TaxID=2596975 RepID=A0A9P8MGD6_9HYPO|nr:hypothetical protein MHUMG1_02600 [Metarhizium humberi]
MPKAPSPPYASVRLNTLIAKASSLKPPPQKSPPVDRQSGLGSLPAIATRRRPNRQSRPVPVAYAARRLLLITPYAVPRRRRIIAISIAAVTIRFAAIARRSLMVSSAIVEK